MDHGSAVLRKGSRKGRPACLRRNRPEHGFTLFELILVIIIVSGLAVVAFDRLFVYQEAAEKAAMEQVAGSLQSAANLQFSRLVVRANLEGVARLMEENPVDWLVRKPDNYAGEFYDPGPGEVALGNWYYDRKDRTLVYLVRRGEHFTVPGDDAKRVGYRLKIVYNRRGTDREASASGAGVAGVVFEPVHPYSWSVQ
ncbi:MAG: type II secretion system protein [Betaproteobacteria bacterium]|nr:type II secretion system protein [Betaproteobacteria bacterium]